VNAQSEKGVEKQSSLMVTCRMLGVRTRAASAAPLKGLIDAAISRSARDPRGAFVERYLALMADDERGGESFKGQDGRANLRATLLDFLAAGKLRIFLPQHTPSAKRGLNNYLTHFRIGDALGPAGMAHPLLGRAAGSPGEDRASGRTRRFHVREGVFGGGYAPFSR